MKILVVDDSKAMRMLVQRALRQAGLGDLELAEASNGAEALKAATAAHFDLVLSDWREVSGVRLAFHHLYLLRERLVVHMTYDEVTLNPAIAAGTFDMPAALKAGAPERRP